MLSALLVVLSVAYLARVYRLGVKSLWLDEGLSVNFAARELPRMLRTLVAEDIHPPLYYLVMNVSLTLFGISEFAVRYSAVLSGVVLVAGAYVFARDLARGGRASDVRSELAGVVTAALVAGSPFLVAYSQEARMYADLALWTTASSLALWRVLEERARAAPGAFRARPRWWLWSAVYVATTVAALYTHYFAGLMLAAHATFVLGLSVRRRASQWWWVALAGGSVLAVTPWVVGLTSQMHRLLTTPDFWKGELTFAFVVEKIFTAFALGKSGIPAQSLPLVALLAVAFGIGLLVLLRSGITGGRAEVFTLTCLVVPLVLLYAISAKNPKFTERYLIMIAPVFYVVLGRLVASGAWALARLVRRRRQAATVALAALVTLGLLGVSAAELRRVYFGPGYEKDDNRAAIAYIEAHAQPGDGIVLMMNSDHVFKYYYHGSLPWRGLHPGDDTAMAASELNAFTEGKQRLWLLLWQEYWADPTGFTRDALDAAYDQVDSNDSFQGLKLRLYKLDPAVRISTTLAPRVARPTNYGGSVRLLGLDPPTAPVLAGQTVGVTFYWQALRRMDEDYIVSLRLLAGGQRWARKDQRPSAFTFPTMMWRPEAPVRGRIALDVPAGVPPGDYDLELVVYDYATTRDLTVIGADGRPTEPRALVGTVTVAPPPGAGDPRALDLATRTDVRLGGLRLVGSTLGLTKVRPGARLDVVLGWQALGATRRDERAVLSIVGADGRAVELSSQAPGGERHASGAWVEGEVALDRRTLLLPADLAAGPATLRVRVEPLGGGNPAGVADVASLEVLARPLVLAAPARIETPVDATFGAPARLLGYALSPARVKPGDQLKLTLHWQALGPAEQEYVVFTHLLDAESRVVAQHDKPPLGGANPTTGWQAGEYVSDDYVLNVPATAAPGDYELEVGLYDPATGARAPVKAAGGASLGDRLVLGKVRVGP